MRYFLFITLSLTAIFSFIALKLNANFSLEKDLLIYIEPGKSSSNIALHLAEKNLTNHPFFLVQYLRLIGKSNSLKSGEYSISNEEDLIDLVSKITEGKYYYRKIQLLEGMRFTEIIELIKKTEGLILNLGKFPEKKILLDLNLSYISPEGIFAPETYFFKKGDTVSNLLERSYKAQKAYSLNLWSKRQPNLPFKNFYEALILASIIEKEGNEKKEIAGVFINRLNSNMKLQSDPTVIYALGETFDGNIRRKDLRIKNPYNTYVNKGLPPGPISLVTKSSIEAVLNPVLSDNLYFVSRGDGTHKFSVTLREHNRAVRKYQLSK